MIQISNEFSFYRDQYQWILCRSYDGKPNKDGETKRQTEKTYHPSIEAMSRHIMNTTAGRCTSLEGMVALFNNAVEVLTEHCDDLVESVNEDVA